MRFALLLTTALTCFPLIGQAQTIKEVTLSNAGLAHYLYEINAEDETIVTLPTKISDMDKLLKSLTLLGEGIETAAISTGSAHALQDVFDTLPFNPEDLSSPARMMAKMPGTNITLTKPGLDAVSGRIMGVSTLPCKEDETCQEAVLLQNETGMLQSVVITPDMVLTINDDQMKEKVERGLTALQTYRSATMRDVVLTIKRQADSTAETFQLSTVLDAPTWKPTYRGMIDSAGNIDLQAWVVLENASGKDWTDVRLTLASGSPRVIDINLYARNMQKNDHNMQTLQMAAPPMADMMGLESAGSSRMAETMAMAPDMEAIAQEGEAGVQFTLPTLVTVPAGEVTSVPFLQKTLDMTLTAYHRNSGGTGDFIAPRKALTVRNTLDIRLPEGVATLYAEGEGYLGDTMIPTIHPNEDHVLDIGEDTRMRIREVQDYNENEGKVQILDGVLIMEIDRVIKTTYEAKGPEKGTGVMTIDHTPNYGTTLTVLEGVEGTKTLLNRTQEVYRFALSLDTGETEKVVVEERQPESRTWALLDLSVNDLTVFLGKTMDDDVRAWMETLIKLRQEEAQANRALAQFEEERNRITDEQNRLSNLLTNLAPGTSAHERMSSDMLALEDQLQTFDGQAQDLRDAAQMAQDATMAHVRTAP